MSGFNRKDGGNPPAKPPDGKTADPAQRSGRPTFDDRGRTVWEWQVQTGSFDLNADSQRIRALTDVELSLAETQAVRQPRFKEEGFNPYGSGANDPNRRAANPYSRSARRPEDVSYDPHRDVRPPPEPPAARPATRPPTPPARPAPARPAPGGSAPAARPAAPPRPAPSDDGDDDDGNDEATKKPFSLFGVFRKKPPG